MKARISKCQTSLCYIWEIKPRFLFAKNKQKPVSSFYKSPGSWGVERAACTYDNHIFYTECQREGAQMYQVCVYPFGLKSVFVCEQAKKILTESAPHFCSLNNSFQTCFEKLIIWIWMFYDISPNLAKQLFFYIINTSLNSEFI